MGWIPCSGKSFKRRRNIIDENHASSHLLGFEMLQYFSRDDYYPKLSDFGLAKPGPLRCGSFGDYNPVGKPLTVQDPMTEGKYPPRGLDQALAVAAMFVQEQPKLRPVIADVVTALTYLASQTFVPMAQPAKAPFSHLGLHLGLKKTNPNNYFP
ncbi:hypothetical protein Bca4012_047155 [Brassica carinata]|nr:unnamed protein product [Brassica napus]CDY10424.1 BnaCnng03250D [Brassica napus]VDD34798.1 unnamed protein product [Brassica oleracea]